MSDYIPGRKQTQSDFESGAQRLNGLSTSLRPDALSFDYLTAFSFGPVADGDVSEGSAARVWRARADNSLGKVFLSRANDENTAFEAETELFSYLGASIVELDLAFEQAARPFVCVERSDGHIWFYWFDPGVGDFVLEDFGAGRTPRALLDNPDDTTESDILVFYMSDADDALVFRQQRDAYDVVYDTPIIDTANKFLEEAARTKDNRVVLIVSVRDQSTGTYTLQRLESTLYPVVQEVEPLDIGWLPETGSIVVLVLTNTTEPDEMDLGWLPQTGTLAKPIIFHTLFDIDSNDLSWLPQSGVLVNVQIMHTLFDVDELDLGWIPQVGVLAVVVIEHTMFDVDEADLGWTPQGGSLVAA